MRKIGGQPKVNRLYEEEKLYECFSNPPADMRLLQFDKGELISQPLEPLTSFYFLIKGSVRIFGIQQDAREFNVHLAEHHTMLGDVEFCGHAAYPFFVEATQPVICLEVPFAANRSALNSDLRFAHFMLDQMAFKLEWGAQMELIAQTVEEKLLEYFKWQPEHTLHHLEPACVQMHCSRRQLQRVLKEFCESGKVVKVGRGMYTLAEG